MAIRAPLEAFRLYGRTVIRSMGFTRSVCHETGIVYWARKGKSDSNCPGERTLVFLHGMGPGLAPYHSFIRALMALGHHSSVLLPEMPMISGNPPRKHTGTRTVYPRSDEIVTSIKRALFSELGVHKADFVGHSYGAVVLTYVVNQAPEIVDRNIYLKPALSLIHISEPTRLLSISYAVFCLKKKKKT
eukprot:TRINITY_DN29198_c0_g1_i2.p2 TRINITY_DN29198_c0_g1~~TRINITY_DN29198_c0_g1_i2.p2  ORF type:complete len:188 (+),score=30.84 TRINITY_DN29198_c0_g1_i2:237-800(+)